MAKKGKGKGKVEEEKTKGEKQESVPVPIPASAPIQPVPVVQEPAPAQERDDDMARMDILAANEGSGGGWGSRGWEGEARGRGGGWGDEVGGGDDRETGGGDDREAGGGDEREAGGWVESAGGENSENGSWGASQTSAPAQGWPPPAQAPSSPAPLPAPPPPLPAPSVPAAAAQPGKSAAKAVLKKSGNDGHESWGHHRHDPSSAGQHRGAPQNYNVQPPAAAHAAATAAAEITSRGAKHTVAGGGKGVVGYGHDPRGTNREQGYWGVPQKANHVDIAAAAAAASQARNKAAATALSALSAKPAAQGKLSEPVLSAWGQPKLVDPWGQPKGGKGGEGAWAQRSGGDQRWSQSEWDHQRADDARGRQTQDWEKWGKPAGYTKPPDAGWGETYDDDEESSDESDEWNQAADEWGLSRQNDWEPLGQEAKRLPKVTFAPSSSGGTRNVLSPQERSQILNSLLNQPTQSHDINLVHRGQQVAGLQQKQKKQQQKPKQQDHQQKHQQYQQQHQQQHQQQYQQYYPQQQDHGGKKGGAQKQKQKQKKVPDARANNTGGEDTWGLDGGRNDAWRSDGGRNDAWGNDNGVDEWGNSGKNDVLGNDAGGNDTWGGGGGRSDAWGNGGEGNDGWGNDTRGNNSKDAWGGGGDDGWGGTPKEGEYADEWEDPRRVRFSQKEKTPWGGSQTETSYTMPSKTLAHAYKGTTTSIYNGIPRNKLNEYTNVKFIESRGAALAPVTNALFGKSRLAQDRIHWMFSPNKDERVSSLLTWIQSMEYNLGAFGLHKFLQSRERGALLANADFRPDKHPNEPAFDWLTFDQLQPSMDRILQESVAFYDPAVQVIVFVFLPSKSGNSIACWRRKINVPNNTRLMLNREIDLAMAGLRKEKDYVVHVDQLPADKSTPRRKRHHSLPAGAELPSLKAKKKRKWWQFFRFEV